MIAVFAGGREVTNVHDGAAWVPDLYQGEVLFFLSSRTGQMVKRAAVGAEGFVVDHYDRTAGLRHDWGLTLTELVNGRFLKPVHEWTRRNQTLFRIQAYGIPPAGISSYANADLPEGEGPRLDFGAGTAAPEERLTNGMRAWLDGPVREAAVVVYVNGRRAGPVWAPPYSVDVTGLLKTGGNQLIEVANTAMNYMAGRQLPDCRLWNLRYGVRFEPRDMDRVKALPSGLLGPVRLIVTAAR